MRGDVLFERFERLALEQREKRRDRMWCDAAIAVEDTHKSRLPDGERMATS